MSPETALAELSQAMLLVLWLSMPPIIVASAVGLIVGLLQGLTQIQEQTLPFAIKLIAVAAALAASAGFLGSQILAYTTRLFTDFPSMI